MAFSLFDAQDSRPSADASFGLNRTVLVVVCVALITEILQLLLSGEPTIKVYGYIETVDDFVRLVGSVFGTSAAVLWIGRRPPPVPGWTLWLALALGGCLYAGNLVFHPGDGLKLVADVLGLLLSPLGFLVVASVLGQSVKNRGQGFAPWASFYLRVTCVMFCLGIATDSGLMSTRYLFPATWDYHVYRIDAAFGAVPAELGKINEAAAPWLQTLTLVVYQVLPFTFFVFLGLSMRQERIHQLHIWRVLTLPFFLAWFCYAWLPVTGPTYAFFDHRFPFAMPAALSVPPSSVIVPPFFRNGMPSMHLTGALLMWMLAIGLRLRIAVAFASLLVIATAWATLASGEHYLLDLIVALPYSAFLGIALIWPQRLSRAWKTAAPIWFAGLFFAVWMIVLRAAPQWLSEHPGFVQLLSLASVLCAVIVFIGIVRDAREAVPSLQVEQAAKSATAPAWIVGAFVASGLAGLMYEVIFSKALAVTFGSTALASYTVLATYMGGMAIGAWLGGRIADAVTKPLLAYACCELLIGGYAIATPFIFKGIQGTYVHFSLDTAPDAAWLTALRVALGVVSLGIPTLIMGATLPLMFKHLRLSGVSSSSAIAPLYGANVAGAAIGSLIAGYALLPAVGRDGGTLIAALISVLVGVYVLDRVKREPASDLLRAEAPKAGGPLSASSDSKGIRRRGAASLLILFVGGAITLSLEINSMHLLAVVAGNSVYAFALMLATFLAGLGLGSQVGGQLMRRVARIDLVAWSQFGIALSIALTATVWDDLPAYFSSFGGYPLALSFGGRETIRAAVCATTMLPPAFFIGMSYPAAMSLATDAMSPQGGARGLGMASGVNTLGNILGVVLTGFWLLPSFGSRDTALVFAVGALALGLLAMAAGLPDRRAGAPSRMGAALRWMPAIAAACALTVFPAHWNYDDLASGGNVYFSAQDWGQVVDHAESVEGGLTTVAKAADGVSTLLTNGKFQGNDAGSGEMIAQESFALYPLLHLRPRDSALVIGYGTGMTTRVLRDSQFGEIQVAELSKDIVSLANRHFSDTNHHVTDDPRVRVRYTDGRNYLLTQSRRFDLISIEITSIWFAGAANLYNKDFYALAKTRLQGDGVLQQWVQLHHINPIDLVYVIGSLRSEFRYVWLYVRGGQGILVASNSAESLKAPVGAQRVNQSLALNDERQPEQLRRNMLLSPAGVDQLVSRFDPGKQFLVSTDRNLFLEYSTPKGNALGDVLASNVRLLGGFEPRDK